MSKRYTISRNIQFISVGTRIETLEEVFFLEKKYLFLNFNLSIEDRKKIESGVEKINQNKFLFSYNANF